MTVSYNLTWYNYIILTISVLGLITFRGALVDVAKLIAQLDRSDRARIDTENRMVDLKNENTKLVEKYNKSNSTIRNLTTEIKECKDKLKNTEEAFEKTSVSKYMVKIKLIL